ncbi:hypothetical protein C8T65DRAFT_740291 [Cerioporus squamosus]|nr:hypothetical protein C8T65DRAFT_740291 [Cerioporus squamosus]
MVIASRTLDAIYFGPSGEPEVKPIPIQNVSMGRGMDIPVITSLFPTPASTMMLAVTFLRTKKTYTVHFPDYPRNAGRRLRNQGARRAYILICRSQGVLLEYSDCDGDNIPLAIRAADFALAYCKGKTNPSDDDMHVQLCEYISKPKGAN